MTTRASVLAFALVSVGCSEDHARLAPGAPAADAAPPPGAAFGEPCAQPDDCASEACVDARCTKPCTGAADCPAGPTWSCEPEPGLGPVCQCVVATEACNGSDDDCDLLVDDGATCPALHSCVDGACACTQGAICGGRCVDLGTSTAHCGACGAACSPPGSCVAGSCTCPGGLTACGGVCVDTTGDVSNCGGCASPCPTGATCSASRCVCPAGECGGACVDLQNDPTHCGSCGHRCLGGACAAGLCQPVVVAQLASPFGVALDATHVYFAGTGGIGRAPLAGGPAELLLDDGPNVEARRLVVAGASVLWTSHANLAAEGAVLSMPSDGGPSNVVASQQNAPMAIALGGSFVVWTGNGFVARAALAGGPALVLASGQGAVGDVVTDGSQVWFASFSGDEIRRVPIDGGPVETFAAAQQQPQAMGLDSTHVYWSNVTLGGTLARKPIAGGAVETLATGVAPQRGIGLDATHVYWADGGASTDVTINRTPIAGGATTVLVTLAAVSLVRQIVLNDDAIFYVEGSTQTVFRLAK